MNGHHTDKVLQDCVHKYIEKFVLCPNCGLPETDYKIKSGVVNHKCAACGHKGMVDMEHKLCTFILAQDKKAKADAKKDAKKKDKKKKDKKDSDSDGDEKKKVRGIFMECMRGGCVFACVQCSLTDCISFCRRRRTKNPRIRRRRKRTRRRFVQLLGP